MVCETSKHVYIVFRCDIQTNKTKDEKTDCGPAELRNIYKLANSAKIIFELEKLGAEVM